VNRYATHVLCPSEWAAAIVSRYTDKPILVTPLGVLPGFGSVGGGEERVEQYARGEFRVLHLSSSTRQRKGTAELVLAWEQLRKSGAFSPEARLTLVLVPEMRMAVIEWLSDRGVTGVMAAELGIELANRLHGKGAPPDQMAHVYGAHHVVCQPSRGESFGLCSLEALACGTPIVATQATGHSQWFASGLPGAVPIPVGPYAEIDDLAGARAPAVRPSDIADALEFARAQWLTLRAAALENAARTREVWSYAESLRPLQTLIEAHS